MFNLAQRSLRRIVEPRNKSRNVLQIVTHKTRPKRLSRNPSPSRSGSKINGSHRLFRMASSCFQCSPSAHTESLHFESKHRRYVEASPTKWHQYGLLAITHLRDIRHGSIKINDSCKKFDRPQLGYSATRDNEHGVKRRVSKFHTRIN
jgi:hypothetical protein